jgi:rhodanese-related sulfurtransferase
MGVQMNHTSITPAAVFTSIGTARAPLLLDVRRPGDFEIDDSMIVGAIRRPPDEVEQWAPRLPAGHRVVVHCVKGGDVSQSVARALTSLGIAASYLEGGIIAWRAEGLPVRQKRSADGNRWITRERPKIDRIACPWLIRRFINPEAEFIYVPTERVFAAAAEMLAIPYDIPGAEPYSHDGPLCTFDTILRAHGIRDEGLDYLALIVRGADTAHPELAPQASGLHAISMGLSANIPDDHAMLEHGMVMYDALYTWCRSLRDEVHNWTPPASSSGSGTTR